LFAAWAIGSTHATEAPFFLMIIAFAISMMLFGIARRQLDELEEIS
jgi:hypothetical protein